MSIKIHSAAAQHTRTLPSFVAANYNGVKAELVPVDFAKATHKSPEYMSKFPMGRVPAAECATTGACFDQATAIFRHVIRSGADVGLYGSSPAEMAKIDMWIQFSTDDIYNPAMPWIYPILGYAKFDHAATEASKDKVLNKNLPILEAYLADRTFLVGDRITAADIFCAAYLFPLFQHVFDPTVRSKLINTTRWFTTIANQPEFLAVQPATPLAAKMAVGSETSAVPAAAPAASSSAAPAAEGEKSSFVLDEFKRKYSNMDDTREAMKWFWENFDAANWSIWKSEHKFPQDNEKKLQSVNLIGGWFQRLERLHKTGMGSVLIFGDEPKLEISGMWIFKGHEIDIAMTECVDFENHAFTKVDIEAEKALIDDYYCWDGSFGGRKFTGDAKIFK